MDYSVRIDRHLIRAAWGSIRCALVSIGAPAGPRLELRDGPLQAGPAAGGHGEPGGIRALRGARPRRGARAEPRGEVQTGARSSRRPPAGSMAMRAGMRS
jgi:hypothetical protein